MAKALIIDDDEGMCYTLANMVRQTGHEATSVHTLSDGLETVFSEAFDTVFLDVQMPDGNGIDILPEIMDAPSKPEVIIITGQGDPDGAELAIKNGAWGKWGQASYSTHPPQPLNHPSGQMAGKQFRPQKGGYRAEYDVFLELTLMLHKSSWKLCELSYVSEG